MCIYAYLRKSNPLIFVGLDKAYQILVPTMYLPVGSQKRQCAGPPRDLLGPVEGLLGALGGLVGPSGSLLGLSWGF